jgi:hypothetical protein
LLPYFMTTFSKVLPESAVKEDRTDLCIRIREKLKENYSQVAFNFAGFADFNGNRPWIGLERGGPVLAGFPWW